MSTSLESSAMPLPDGIRLTTLPNGIRVASEHLPGVRSVSVGFWIGVGSRDEVSPLEGATHFLEHLLFKGTRSRTPLEIAQVLDQVGGDMNAFTSKEYTAYYARCLDRDLPAAVDVLGDMLTASLVLPEEVENERDVVLEEIRMHLDDPSDLVHSEFAHAVFGDHPLGREVLGTNESMTAMTRDQVAGWWQSRYTTDVITVACAGNVDHDELVALVTEAMGAYEPGSQAEGVAGEEITRPASALRVRPRPTEQAHLVLGGMGLPRGHRLRWAQTVLNQALGGGMASRLFQEVREKRGMAYSVYSYPATYADVGTFGVYVGTAPKRAGEVVDVVREELSAVVRDNLSEDERRRSKGYLTGATIMALEDTSSRMTRIGRALTTGTPLLSLDEIMEAIDTVSADDVAEVAEILLGGPKALAVVGPLEAGDLSDVV
ncbi:M16 family metallopeptidase [Euzebya tangerina]|uniref:M16 family metallopeptidase n=1 Tax=Euzebya tangerina TaxID=591198 RepID=UPI00196B61DF|nr:pitrilysin family protein [Euzebya tangerina]